MLVPNNHQAARLFQFAGTARFAYNWALIKEKTAFESGEKFISSNDLQKEFTLLRNSSEYQWLRTISNNVTKRAIYDCVLAYQRFFRKKAGYPRFKSKRHGNFNFYQDTYKIRITSTHVKLESAENFSDGLGIDLGIKNLAVCSDGTTYSNINQTKTVKKLKKQRRRLQRSISRKYEMNNKKGKDYSKTRNIIKSEKKLLKIHHRLANIRQNYRHQITSEIIKRKPSFIVLENLNVRGMMSNRHLSKAVQEQGFSEFRRQIEYKSEWAGIKVIIADRFYPSSKTCIVCGSVKKNLRLSERIYRCENCGNEIDRDLQAAINLKRYGENLPIR